VREGIVGAVFPHFQAPKREIQFFNWRLHEKIWLVAALTVFVLSCGGRDKEGGSAGNKVENNTKAKPQSASQSQGQDPSELDKMVRGSIKPFFDKEASVTSRAVSPGESFEVFVFGGCSSSYTMSAAEFRLSLPEGVIITGEIKSDSTNITMGETLKDYMMAFRCSGAGRNSC